MNHHEGEIGPTEYMDRHHATQALLATLGEYDALWNGVLFPEIVDAGYYDCPSFPPFIVDALTLMTSPVVQQIIDRTEALDTVLATVTTLAKRCPKELYSEGVDAVFGDCQTLEEIQTLDPRVQAKPE